MQLLPAPSAFFNQHRDVRPLLQGRVSDSLFAGHAPDEDLQIPRQEERAARAIEERDDDHFPTVKVTLNFTCEDPNSFLNLLFSNQNALDFSAPGAAMVAGRGKRI